MGGLNQLIPDMCWLPEGADRPGFILGDIACQKGSKVTSTKGLEVSVYIRYGNGKMKPLGLPRV